MTDINFNFTLVSNLVGLAKTRILSMASVTTIKRLPILPINLRVPQIRQTLSVQVTSRFNSIIALSKNQVDMKMASNRNIAESIIEHRFTHLYAPGLQNNY